MIRKNHPSRGDRAVSAARPVVNATVASTGSRALLLTGTIGAGKSVLAAEIGDLLEERDVPAAVIDIDWLGWTTLKQPGTLMWKNLAAVWGNYAGAGIRFAVMARLIQSRDEIDELHRVLPGMEITVVRVDSSPELVEKRLRGRDSGRILEQHLSETAAFAAAVETLGVENFTVMNGDRPIREVAIEVLNRLGWI